MRILLLLYTSIPSGNSLCVCVDFAVKQKPPRLPIKQIMALRHESEAVEDGDQI